MMINMGKTIYDKPPIWDWCVPAIGMVIWGTVYGIVLSTFDVLRGIVEIYDNGIDWDEFDHRRTMRSLE